MAIINSFKRWIAIAATGIALSGCAGTLENRIDNVHCLGITYNLKLETYEKPQSIIEHKIGYIDSSDGSRNPDLDADKPKPTILRKKNKYARLDSIIGAGVLMGVADFFLQTVVHEGSHALATEIVGGDVTEFHPFLKKVDDRQKFGYIKTQFDTPPSKEEQAYIFISPKITNALILSTYAIMQETDSLPEDQFAQLALWTVVAGSYIDMYHDIFSRTSTNDVVGFEKNLKMSWQARLAFRGALAISAFLAGYELFKGADRIFNPEKYDRQDHDGTISIGPGSISYNLNF